MGASAGRVVGDQGENIGISTIKTGKNEDEDEDFNWDYGEQGGGVQEGSVPRRPILDRLQIVEQVKQNLSHQRHKRLHVRQELDDGTFLEGAAGDAVSLGGSDMLSINTALVTTSLDLSSLSIFLPSPSLAPSISTDINTSLPIGSSLQTFLSSTPPPSPAQTSPGMTIPPTPAISVPSATPSLSQNSSGTGPPTPAISVPSTTSSLSQNSSGTGPSTGPSTTVTSSLASLSFRNNGTSLTNTGISTTIDGTVFVFAFPTGTGGSTRTGNSSTNSFTSSNSTNISAISTDPAMATEIVGGIGSGSSPTASSAIEPLPTTTRIPGNNSPPVSPSLLGGVLGGVAGLAFILVAILFLIRRHKRVVAAEARDDAGYGGPLGSSGGNPMTEGSSITPFALAGNFFARHSRASRVSESSEAPTVLSETGFYKVSGRKLPPVLGGPRPGYGSTRSAGGSSSYPDEDGGTLASTPSVSGPSRYPSIASASPTISSAPMSSIAPPILVSAVHPHMVSSMAPPPPRIQEEASESDTESTHQLPRPPMFPRQLSAISVGSVGKDGVGRSLPSHDGSRASRFTEDIV